VTEVSGATGSRAATRVGNVCAAWQRAWGIGDARGHAWTPSFVIMGHKVSQDGYRLAVYCPAGDLVRYAMIYRSYERSPYDLVSLLMVLWVRRKSSTMTWAGD